MKIAYIGASGDVGKRVVPELVSRGQQVTAISKHPDRLPTGDGITPREGDIDDPETMTGLLKGHDVVVSSVQFKKYDHEKLIAAVKASGVPRYFVCGGSGTAHAPGTTTRIMDLPSFPEAAMVSATNAARFFDRINQESELDWTFITPPPPPGFAPGTRTGRYRTGQDEMLVPEGGKPGISYEDYAIAIADEIGERKHKGRYTVGY